VQLNELLKNPRVSYQVIVTFDLRDAETRVYAELREEFARELDLEVVLFQSKEDGGGTKELPFNTLAALWAKDETERQTRDHFERKLKDIFAKKGLKGRFLVVVAQNWAVGAGDF
jgi:hypothetical protein